MSPKECCGREIVQNRWHIHPDPFRRSAKASQLRKWTNNEETGTNGGTMVPLSKRKTKNQSVPMEGTGVDAGPLAASVDAGPSLPASVDAGPSMPADVLEAQPREQAAVHARDRAAVQESEVNARNVRARRMDAPRQSSGAPNETADDPEEDPHNLHRFVLRQRDE